MEIQLSKKLVSSIILMVVSLSLMVTATFAWFTLSTAPSISEIKVTIGGDNTIMIAQDMMTNIGGSDIHYPGIFVDSITLQAPKDALLSPVSTADGINWYIPTVNEKGEMIVEDISDFTLDAELQYANTNEGGYAYIDFWIVSPLDDCFIRVCSGVEEEIGSYVVQLPRSVKNFTNNSGYSLDDSYQSLSSSIRVGFLVDDEIIEDNEPMNVYVNSLGYREDYRTLKGNYENNGDYDFLIYEPNGLSHPREGHSVRLSSNGVESVVCEDGEYWVTNPVGLDRNGNVGLINIADRLIVQSKNGWIKEGDILKIDELYQSYLLNNPTGDINSFYKDYMKDTYLQYVYAGNFFADTWELYSSRVFDRVHKDDAAGLEKTNAVTSSEIVILEKNVPQRVRMFIWIEGQDVDCNVQAASQKVALRLELAGSTGTGA